MIVASLLLTTILSVSLRRYGVSTEMEHNTNALSLMFSASSCFFRVMVTRSYTVTNLDICKQQQQKTLWVRKKEVVPRACKCSSRKLKRGHAVGW